MPAKGGASEVPGAVVVTKSKTFLRLGRDPSYINSSGGYLDVEASSITTRIDEPFGVVTAWRVWRNEDDTRKPGADPLISTCMK